MSFAGHVFDMIRRDKAFRDERRLRRERFKRGDGLYIGNGTLPSNITAEELDVIHRQIKAREEQQQRYFIRMTFIILGALALITLLFWGVFMFLL